MAIKRAKYILMLGIALLAFLLPNISAGSTHQTSFDEALHISSIKLINNSKHENISFNHSGHSICVGLETFFHHLIFHNPIVEAAALKYPGSYKPASSARSNPEKTHSYAAVLFDKNAIVTISKAHSVAPRMTSIAAKELNKNRRAILLI